MQDLKARDITPTGAARRFLKNNQEDISGLVTNTVNEAEKIKSIAEEADRDAITRANSGNRSVRSISLPQD